MECNDKKEPCSTNLTNENIPNQKEVNIKKKEVSVIDEEDDVDIENYDGNEDNIRLIVENTLGENIQHDEWLIIEEYSDSSIDSDIGIESSLNSKKYSESKKNNTKTPELVSEKIKNCILASKVNELISHINKTKNKSDIPSSKLNKHIQTQPNSTLNDLYRPSCSTSISDPSYSNNLPGPSCPTSIPGPSSSNSLPGPSCMNKSGVVPPHKLPSLHNNDSSHTNFKLQREQPVRQSRSLENTELNKNNEVSNLEDCGITKHNLLKNLYCGITKHNLSEKLRIYYSFKEPDKNNTECFVEDPDFVNPDIMYNIDLKEYYNKFDLLKSKILETPDDPTGLIEYKQFPPIPPINKTRRVFTEEERFTFENGISEWEYQIDRDDWNKIMVKRAVVFTAHAGFSIANEESLYVLADVAIDYVKKLAVIMKKNFDIQANDPDTDIFDPIHYGLREVGLENGIRELFKHYEDDVIGRRRKLLKKCRYIKEDIEHHIGTLIRTQNRLEKQKLKNKENVIKIKIESIIKEEPTEIESGIEEVIVETQFSTDENLFTDSKIEQIDSFYRDKTDMEVKMDTGPRNIEYIKINAKDIKRRKINYSITPDNTKVMGFDSSKQLDNVPINRWIYSSGSEVYPVPKKTEKLLDSGTPKKVMKYLYSPLGISSKLQSQVPDESVGALGLSRMADQLDEDFNHYQDSVIENNVQTIYVHTLSDPDEAISMNDDNTDNTVQIIPVVNENDDSDSNIDYDIVSVDSFL